jgi:hypothetical protein
VRVELATHKIFTSYGSEKAQDGEEGGKKAPIVVSKNPRVKAGIFHFICD